MSAKVNAMKFTVPVVYTTSGWITIEANSLNEAKEKAFEMNVEDGVEYFAIKDPDSYSTCEIDEITYSESEDQDKSIRDLFYAEYSYQYESSAGEVDEQGKLTLLFYNPFTGSNVKATLNDDGSLHVEDM